MPFPFPALTHVPAECHVAYRRGASLPFQKEAKQESEEEGSQGRKKLVVGA